VNAIEKIKKLLRLGGNSAATPAEAALAMSKAIELAKAHGIDLYQIDLSEGGTLGGLTHQTEPSQKGLPQRLASMLVRRHFGVSTIFESGSRKSVIHFVGVESQCQLARYCYVYLVRTLRAAWRNRSNRRIRNRESFLRGFAEGISRLMPEVFHVPGLIVAHDDYITQIILGPTGKLVTLGRKKPIKLADSAFGSGFREGRKSSIRNAIRGTSNPLLD